MRFLNLFNRNPAFFICCILFFFIGGLCLLFIPKAGIVISINRQHNALLDHFFYYITFIGDGWFYVIIILFLFFRYGLRHAALGAVTFALTSGAAQFFKHFVFENDVRPKKLLEGIYELHVVQGVDIHSYYSFPSGHTVTAFSIFCLLSLIQKNKMPGILYSFIALLVGISRVYLGQHFFHDVYFGALLGILITWIIYYFFDKFVVSAS